MNTQKIQASSNVKGFTLVELIVVITILVILGTIAFLNLGGMSASARDSQRTSDLNQINTQIMVTQAKNGTSYVSMVSGLGTSSTIEKLGGTGAAITATVGGSYQAGDVNYTLLGVDSSKMKDPVSGALYKMGATTLAGSAYQLAASLEETKTALVMGTYNPRTTTSSASSGTVSGSTIVLSNGIGTFKLNDYVYDGTATGQVTGISTDLKTLTMSAAPTAAATNFTLATSESTGLIGGTGALGTSFVTNKGTILPY